MYSQAARLALLVMFLLSCSEKSVTLAQRRARWHPLLLAGARRRHATLLMSLSLSADLMAVLYLVGAPQLGVLLAGILTLCYTALAVALPIAGGKCGCFAGVFETSTRTGLLVRNGLIVAIVASSLPWKDFSAAIGAGEVGLAIAIFGSLAVVTSFVDQAAAAATRNSDERYRRIVL